MSAARPYEARAEPERPEADRAEGAPHPRATPLLYGQKAAEAALLDAFATGRMHHGWLFTGPRGVGKATLAWRMARFLLATPDPAGADAGLFGAAPTPDSPDIPADHPVARRLAALAEPGLFLLRRAWDEDRDRLKAQITVDEVRRMKGFFALSAADGGRRIAIVDAADDMNPNAANALLKILEEPPAGAVIFLIAHQPSRLLPTIRSRCRELRLAPLGPADIARALDQAGVTAEDPAALAELAGGSAGDAIRLIGHDGLALYREIAALFATLPRLDRTAALKLADTAAARGVEGRFELMLDLFDLFLARLARAGVAPGAQGAAAPEEAALWARLAPDAHSARIWAALQQSLGARARQGRAVNLDPAALLMDMVLQVNATAARIAA